MDFKADIGRLLALRLDEAVVGDTIVFCTECPFQVTNAALKPHCPECGTVLHTIRVTEEVVAIVRRKDNEKNSL